MSKAVLISIQPKWCELIANGKKTVEVRKTKPKLKPPFKCYIYCTKDKNNHFWTGKRYSYADDHSHNAFDKDGNGKVIGEFICDSIIKINYNRDGYGLDGEAGIIARSCVPEKELYHYLQGKTPYLWHISDLVIYDKPRELNEFYRECGGIDDTGLCYECDKVVGEECDCAVNYELHFTRPPQSWCYVEQEG